MNTAIADPIGPDPRTVPRALKPGQMLTTLPDRLVLARQQKMTHAGFLELVPAGEHSRRESKPASPRARAAGPDPAMRLDPRDDTAAVTCDRQLRNELTSPRLPDGPHGALILGPAGVGKTHLARAPGHIAIRRRRTVLMASAARLFKRPRAARPDNTPEAEMRRITGIDLLILDDFAPQPPDPTETAGFYQLCAERHRKAPTVVTSNRTPDEWLSTMADPLPAQSAADRLASTTHELIIEGQSYRHRQKPALTKTTRASIDDEKGNHHDHS